MTTKIQISDVLLKVNKSHPPERAGAVLSLVIYLEMLTGHEATPTRQMFNRRYAHEQGFSNNPLKSLSE